ncbi:MAG: beta-propeller fold lactonase family protein [Deltaproteobacteria bacterium]|nr:beta-propeller fold lactonase family protein [Deltaproteobacteria bacterium]
MARLSRRTLILAPPVLVPLGLSLVLLLWAACGDDGASTDSGVSGDSAIGDSASPNDSSSPTDTGTEADSASTDSATPPDASRPPARDRLMYVSVGGEPRLAVVTLGADGTMTARSEFDLTLPANPGAMTYARTARRLYLGVGGRLATVRLEDDGRPRISGFTPGVGNPVYVETANSEATVLTAYFGDDFLRSYDASGTPPHGEVDSAATAEEPHAARIGPSGLLYVPHRNGQTTDWYSVAAGGTLTRSGGLAAEAGAGPRHIAFSPDGSFAYVINEFTDSVSAHTIAADGSLTRMQTITTLPAGFDGDSNTCADVHVTPDGRFLYGSNRGHDSLAMFAIAEDGRLTGLGQVATEARPREFDLSPDGRFVVAAGQDSGALQSYRIEDDGTLTSVARLDVGAGLRWVIID